MLDATQETLLRTLTTVANEIAPTAREPFVADALEGRQHYLSISHSGLASPVEVYRGEVLALEHADLIRAYDRKSSVSFVFDVTPLGLRRASAAATPAEGAGRTDGASRQDARRWGRWVAIDAAAFKTSNMSALWRVRDEADETRSIRVLKTLKYAKGRGSASYKRFVREIQTLATVLHGRHAGIIEVLDFSTPEEGDTREAYYVMPLASGSLKDLARDLRGEFGPVLRKLTAVADALHVAHTGNVIHRDIKPDNILLFDGVPVLADFGICYLAEDDRLTRTEAHTVGTDDFVAPELLGGGRSGAVTPAADVYSFGKTLFAVVSGGDVFPRERYDDERYDLVARFDRPELAHLRGLIERMVSEDPTARPQSMAEVSRLLVSALANLDERVPYREGMYADGTRAASRARHLRRVLATTSARPRRDAVRAEIALAVGTAVAGIAAYSKTTGGMSVNGPHESALQAAAAAAEEMIAVGLPLVEADEQDAFAEWLGAVFEPLANRSDNQYAANRRLLHPAAVLAAHAAGALAWRLKRFEVLAQILDQYVSNTSRWIHQEILGDNASALLPWIKSAMSASEVVRWLDAALASDPGAGVSIVNGLVVLRLLNEVDARALEDFMATADGFKNPLPFAPGFIDVEWVQALVSVGLQRGPVERDLARVIFDRSPEEFRRMCGDLGNRLQYMVHFALRQLNRVPYFSLGINPEDWKRWTGVALPT